MDQEVNPPGAIAVGISRTIKTKKQNEAAGAAPNT